MNDAVANSSHWIVLPLAFVYFLPTVVAMIRHHTHAVGVFFINLLFGWTGIGWVVAQIWSFTNDPVSAAPLPEQPS